MWLLTVSHLDDITTQDSMNIEGVYKVNIEHTVRKMSESEDETIARMLSWVGLRPSDIPPDPDKEAKIQKIIAQQQDELATTLRLEITADRASVRSTDGNGDYRIKSRMSTGDGKVSLIIEIAEVGEDIQWDIVVIGDRFLVFTGESDMSGFVLERV
jgi:hypothetical protein